MKSTKSHTIGEPLLGRRASARAEVPVLPRKPMARALKTTLFEREVRERLSGAAVEILLGRARVLAEGQRSASPTAAKAFFGSIMLTIDLAEASGEVREACDPATAEKVAALMAADARVLKRVRQVAEREGGKIAGGPIRAHSADVRVWARGTSVHVDVDVEG